MKSSTTLEQCPPASLPELAVIGRSNVGKSSLINALTNQSSLAKVSKTPGETGLPLHCFAHAHAGSSVPGAGQRQQR